MSHQVTLRATGNQFEVEPDETVLEAALRQRLVLPYSCRIGSCGTCKARLLQGRVDPGVYQEQALTPAERDQGMVLLCRAKPHTDLVVDAREVVAAEEIEIKLLPARVIKLQRLSDDVMGVTLRLPQNQSFNYLPGQYVDILLRDGRRRSFSIANPPGAEGQLEFHVRHVPGGFFTSHIFTEMKERDLLRLQGPLGTFFLREESDRPLLLMAGGTGFAPIKAMVEHAIALEITRPMHLFWGVRAKQDLYLGTLADEWAQAHDHFQFTPVLSEPVDTDQWDGHTGWVHDALVSAYPTLSDYEVYASGPPPMIEAGRKVFSERGLPVDQLFYDSFEFAADVPAQQG